MPLHEQTARVAFVLPETDVDAFVADVEAAGGRPAAGPAPFEPADEVADLFGDQLFEPLSIIAVTLSAAFLMTRLGQVWSDLKHPRGLFVDARTVPAQMYETAALDRGAVIILFEDRKEVYAREERDSALEALQKIFGVRQDG